MSAQTIDGKAFAAQLRGRIAEQVATATQVTGKNPGLAVVLVGDDPASQVYVRNKGKMTREAGMESFEYVLPASTTQEELLDKVEELNTNDAVDGILVQLPLPPHLNEETVINAIDPSKDVDGFHVINSGKLVTAQSDGFVPCTPLGCLMLLRDTCGDLSGKHAVVIGRSNIVGKPMAQLLLNESCTVTICHSRTQNLQNEVKRADIVVAAVGRPEMVTGEWLKEGAVVIDVGINRIETSETKEDGSPKTRLTGDVDFQSASEIAQAITPVPGGVGPMTIACLLRNTLQSFCQRHNIAFAL